MQNFTDGGERPYFKIPEKNHKIYSDFRYELFSAILQFPAPDHNSILELLTTFNPDFTQELLNDKALCNSLVLYMITLRDYVSNHPEIFPPHKSNPFQILIFNLGNLQLKEVIYQIYTHTKTENQTSRKLVNFLQDFTKLIMTDPSSLSQLPNMNHQEYEDCKTILENAPHSLFESKDLLAIITELRNACIDPRVDNHRELRIYRFNILASIGCNQVAKEVASLLELESYFRLEQEVLLLL